MWIKGLCTSLACWFVVRKGNKHPRVTTMHLLKGWYYQAIGSLKGHWRSHSSIIWAEQKTSLLVTQKDSKDSELCNKKISFTCTLMTMRSVLYFIHSAIYLSSSCENVNVILHDLVHTNPFHPITVIHCVCLKLFQRLC